jgi:hypothetical protein
VELPRPASGCPAAATSPGADDPLLRDRVLAIPFDPVWQTAAGLVGGGLRGFSLQAADDHEGVMEGTVRGLGGSIHHVRVEVALDANAQTVLRATVTATRAGADYGRARRRLRRLMAALDGALAGARPMTSGPLSR